jgi:uncharacterized protein YjbI with pentapeptide repeats
MADLTRTELIKLIAVATQPLNLTGVDLCGVNLSWLDLSGANLYNAKLLDANLSLTNLTKVNLTGADLTGADLQCADLIGADLTEASFEETNLDNADLSGVLLTRANLTGANLTDVDLTGARITETSFDETILRNTDFSKSVLTDVDLTEANLIINIDLSKATLFKVKTPIRDSEAIDLTKDRDYKINKVLNLYYSQLNEEDITQKVFKLWIESLEEPKRSSYKNKGLDSCRGVLNFQRFILELQDKGLEEYLKNNLSNEDFNYWKANK